MSMTVDQAWYLAMFVWGLVSAWAVISGLEG